MNQPHSGCDAYYFLLSREIFLRNKKIPVKLPPYYTLEYEEQWYPPGFTIFLSIIPKKILDKFYWVISPLIDTLICLSLFTFIYMMVGVEGALIASLFYMFSPATIGETSSLTSRQLGSLLFNITAFAGIYYSVYSHYYLFIIAILSGVLLLLTHKLSTQALCIAFTMMAILTSDINFIILLVAIVLASIVLSGGFYLKIFRCHMDYILFWSKNYNALGCHQVDDSEFYGSTEIDIKSPIYKKGAAKNYLFDYLISNLYVLIPGTIIVQSLFNSSETSPVSVYFSLFSIIILITGLLTYLIPYLRGIGFMAQYGKLAMPAALFAGTLALNNSNIKYLSYVVLALFIYGHVIRKISFLFKSRDNAPTLFQWDIQEMQMMFEYISSINDPLFMCLPNNYCDLLVYHCRIRVMWGGHGSPASRLQPLVPVLSEPVTDIIRNHKVTHLLIDNRYASPEKLKIDIEPVWSDQNISIYDMRSQG